MRRFAWRLQRVLDIREKEEQIKRVQLLGITEKLAKMRSELLLQKITLKSMLDSLSEEHPRDRLGKQEFFLKCSTKNDVLVKRLESKINELEVLQKEKIAEVLKAKQFKEGLDKLRVEAKMQFIKEQEKLEQKDADGMTIMNFARKIMAR